MSYLMERVKKIVEAANKMDYIPHKMVVESSPSASKVIIDGKKYVNFCTNNFLDLANDPRVIKAKIEATKKYGIGAVGSRWMAGNHRLHIELEEKIAEFKGCEAAIIFSSGTLTNNGAIKAILDPALLPVIVKNKAINLTDEERNTKIVICLDEMDHASIFDACSESSGVEMIRTFKHLMTEQLERLAKRYSQSKKEKYSLMIIVDGVYSTLGTIAPLPEILQIAKKYNATLMVDDAHGLGCLGKTGKGTAEHFNIKGSEIDINMGTFSKAAGIEGGYIAGRKELAEFLQANSRKYIFNAAMPPDNCAAIMKSLEIMKSEPERREKLHENARLLRNGLNALGYNTLGSETQIVPILIGEESITKKMCLEILEAGFFVRAFIYPAAPLGKAIFRTNVIYSHKKRDIEKFLDVMDKLGKKYNLV